MLSSSNRLFLRVAMGFLGFALPATTALGGGGGRVLEVAYAGSNKPGELVFPATYRVWIPDGVTRLRGIIVHQHGCGKGARDGGMTAADDLHWQALARKWDCALLGPSYYQEDGDNCRLWCDPRNGSRKRFLQALDELSEMSNHPELKTVPWCLWGHSGGAFWASLMMASDPDRIVAVWLRSGTAFTAWEKGEIPKPEIPSEAYAIPVMCNPGKKEETDSRFRSAWTGATEMFAAYRRKGAPIALAPDPRTAHECGDSRYLAIPYLDACLAMRLPDPVASNGSHTLNLKPVDMAKGWLAVPLSETASAPGAFAGEAAGAVWLPGEQVARAWEQYVKTGAVDDATPPPPPIHVTSSRTENAVEITWDAEADFESGLREFIIRRGGKELARLPKLAVSRFGRPLFQGLSYHDTPMDPVLFMRYVDLTAKPGEQADYEVIAVNGVGQTSSPGLASRGTSAR